MVPLLGELAAQALVDPSSETVISKLISKKGTYLNHERRLGSYNVFSHTCDLFLQTGLRTGT